MKKKDIKIKETQELQNQLARAVADYQNLQKRVEAERKEWIRSANKELLMRMLPVFDTLMLASQHVMDPGVSATLKQFGDVLKSEGVEKIETVGKPFDPKIMECVETGEGEDGKVLAEVRSGYTLNGQVLRAAQVRVGKGDMAKIVA